jgi:hypothetical protein
LEYMFVQFTQVFRRRMRQDYWLAIVKSVPTHIWEWTDGSGAQFKQRRAFADISDSPADLGYAVTRSYCESYHGKLFCNDSIVRLNKRNQP